MDGVYITIYQHKNGTIYVQLNKTIEGQSEFVAGLSKQLFNVLCMSYQNKEEIDD